MSVTGSVDYDEFDEFADKLEDVAARVPPDVIKDAIDDTMHELVGQVTNNLKIATTAKGGTYDSRTGSSPYSPGGENDSSTDNYHISDRNAWYTDSGYVSGEWTGVIQPKLAVKDRAYWIERGTANHKANGDTPQHFYVNGIHIVMAEKPSRNSPNYNSYIQQASDDRYENPVEAAQFGFGEQKTVAGIERLGYFAHAVEIIKKRRVFSKNLNKHWKKVLQEEGFEA